MPNQLHPVPQPPGPRLYCGPTAICAVTGVAPHRATWAIQRVRGNWHPVVGVNDYEMCAALALLGWGVRVYNILGGPGYPQPTFRTWIIEQDPFDGAMIVGLAGHYVAVSYTEMVDNQTGGIIVPLHMNLHGRKLIRHTILVHPLSRRKTIRRRVDRPTLSPVQHTLPCEITG